MEEDEWPRHVLKMQIFLLYCKGKGVPVHAIKTKREVEEKNHSFLTFALDVISKSRLGFPLKKKKVATE